MWEFPTCEHSIKIPYHVDPTTRTHIRPCERVKACEHSCQDNCSTQCEAQHGKEHVPSTLPCCQALTLPQISGNIRLQEKHEKCGR